MTTAEITTEYRRLDELVPAVRNPKGHDLPEIEASLYRHGFVEPIIDDARTGRLIGGHGRLEVLMALMLAERDVPRRIRVDDGGQWLVPVNVGYESADDVEAEALLLSLNRLPEAGGIADQQMLVDMLADLSQAAAGLAGTGFTDEQVAEMMAAIVVPDFTPEAGGGQPRLDQRNPVVCPNCQHEFHPR